LLTANLGTALNS